jgi:flagellar hook-length control protein FliK
VSAPQAPPPAAAFTPPATQIAMRIVPLRLDADGVHRLTVNLHPVDLGPVQVVAEIRNGEINLQLTGSTDAGNDALRNALDDLRRELRDAGFANTTLDLRQGGGQQDQARQQFAFRGETASGNPGGNRGGNQSGRGPGGPPGTGPETAAPRITGTGGNSRLDVRA